MSVQDLRPEFRRLRDAFFGLVDLIHEAPKSHQLEMYDALIEFLHSIAANVQKNTSGLRPN